jgi:DNA polymerase III, delta subunit
MTRIILTHTQLDLARLKFIIAKSFFDSGRFDVGDLFDLDSVLWKQWQSSGRLIDYADFDTSQKDKFVNLVQNEVYRNYTQPTLLYLGDLNDYSDSLQESMLKLLEEPPDNLQIVLFAQNQSQIKPTIKSRSVITQLDLKLVFGLISKEFGEKIAKLPPPGEVVQKMLKNEKVEIDKVSDYERNELDFWMWQIQTNLEILFKSSPQSAIAKKLSLVIQARKLNNDNVQKKFVVGQMWL